MCKTTAPASTNATPNTCIADNRSLKNTYPSTAAIPPDNVLITVTTETDPAIAPHENAEKPPRFIKLAPVNVAQFFSGGIFSPSLIFNTITTSTHRPTR